MSVLRPWVFICLFFLPLLGLSSGPTNRIEVLDEWNQKMWNKGFEWFNRPLTERLKPWDVDQIYYQFGSQKFVVFRYFEKNEKLVDQGTHLREIPDQDGKWVLAFEKFNQSEINNLTDQFQRHIKQSQANSSSWKWSLLLKKAHAANGPSCSVTTEKLNAYRGVFGNLTGQSLMNCMSQVYSGATTNLDGKVESVRNFGLSFSFDFVLKTFSGLMTFAKDLPQHMKKIAEGAGQAWDWMKSANLDDQVSIACAVMGNIGSEGVTSFLTRGPAGIASLIARIGEILSKFSFVKKLMDLKAALLSKGSEVYESMKTSIHNLMMGVLNGRVSESQVDDFAKGVKSSCRL